MSPHVPDGTVRGTLVRLRSEELTLTVPVLGVPYTIFTGDVAAAVLPGVTVTVIV